MPAMPAGQNRKSSAALTRAPAWRALAAHRKTWQQRHLRELFAADPQRFTRFSTEACGLLLDYSKCLIVPETLDLLLALAHERGLEARIAELLAGKRVNTTEKRAAWHTALRAGDAAPREVRSVLAAMRAFTGALGEGRVAGASGRAIRDVLSLGIGGSALGPALAAGACAPDEGRPRVHFATTPGEPLARTLTALDPETTLVIIQSKSFSTRETLLNARAARDWLQSGFAASGHGMHFAAVTANAEAAHAFGVPPERIFPMWDWVGGRYSLWSAVGLPAMIAMGADRFDDMLAGAAAMDAHFAQTPLQNNLPVLMALTGLWHANFFGMDSRAVVPYGPGLELLPAWLQQLEMESLGKSVSRKGRPLRHDSGAALWGGAGTEGQHAYFQMLHQGTRPVPVDFIACCSPRSKSSWGAPRSDADAGTHALMLANCFAQSALLMQGVTAAETAAALRAGGAGEREAARLSPHQALPGNRPSNMLLLDALTPRSLGALLALYEHRTYVQSALWDINAFDQWGVEHGKTLADSLLPEFSSPASATKHDASTNGLVNYVKKMNTEKP
jgi:glucose-6-phosphate isomerase